MIPREGKWLDKENAYPEDYQFFHAFIFLERKGKEANESKCGKFDVKEVYYIGRQYNHRKNNFSACILVANPRHNIVKLVLTRSPFK